MGWEKGLEPSTPGTTIRCSNQLSYTHHMDFGGVSRPPPGMRPGAWGTQRLNRQADAPGDCQTVRHHVFPGGLARQEGLEPTAYCLEGSCSILLSYWRIVLSSSWSG